MDSLEIRIKDLNIIYIKLLEQKGKKTEDIVILENKQVKLLKQYAKRR